MPKGTQRNVRGTPASNRGKSRKKQRATNRPVANLTSKQKEVPSKVVSPAPTVSLPTTRAQQITPQSYILSDLKRIGIISGAMLIILIILSLVL